MKRKIIIILAVFFFLLGLGLIIVPQISNQIGKEIAQSTIEDFEISKRQSAEEPPPDITKSDEHTTSEASNEQYREETGESQGSTYIVDMASLYRDSLEYNRNLEINQLNLLINENSYQQTSLDLRNYGIPNGVYGYISAPSIGMELPIYLGATNSNMAYGAAHMTYTSLPIGGKSSNCVLAAHTGYIGRIFFDYICNLNIGDTVEITNYWEKLTYTVTEKHIYKSYESSDCYIQDSRDLLTLITCAHYGKDRYYVICERK